jgi:hypothetical protein
MKLHHYFLIFFSCIVFNAQAMSADELALVVASRAPRIAESFFDAADFLQSHNVPDRLAKLNPKQRLKYTHFFSMQQVPDDLSEGERAKTLVLGVDYAEDKDILQSAIELDSQYGVATAVQMGAKVDYAPHGRTPLRLAILRKASNALQGLLSHGARATTDDVQHAVWMKSTADAYELALNVGVDLDTPFNVAVGYGFDKKPTKTLLAIAIGNDDFLTALKLLEKKVGIGQIVYSHGSFRDRKLPLPHIISKIGWPEKNMQAIEVLGKILESGYAVNKIWEYQESFGGGYDPVENRYIGYFYELNIYRKDVLVTLIQHRADVNHFFYQNNGHEYGWTPLLKAIFFNKPKAVQFLLQANADINQSVQHIKHDHAPQHNPPPCTPIEFATYYGREEIIALLIEAEKNRLSAKH